MSNRKKIKKVFLFSSSLFLTAFVSAISTVSIANSYLLTSNNTNNNLSKESSSTNDVIQKNNLVPLDYFAQTALLTQKTGPIISYGDKITAVNWYGSEIWNIDFTKTENATYLPGGKYDSTRLVPYTKRAFINWALDQKNNKLWLLSNTFNTTTISGGKPVVGPQNVIEVDSLTGKILSSTTLVEKPASDWQLFYQIQVLSNGNIQVYAQGNGNYGKNILINAKTKEQKFSNTQTKDWNDKIKSKFKYHLKKDMAGEIRMLYLIPVQDDVNIAVFCDFSPNKQSFQNGATSDLLLCLVDDNFEEINITDTSSPWYNYVYIDNTSTTTSDYSREGNNFNKSIYTTLDGRVYYTAWEKFFVFYPNFKVGSGVGVSTYEFPKDKKVQSYTMDVNENVFLKFWNDTKIYKLSITKISSSNTNFSLSTYYDIGNAGESIIRDNAESFILYNVTGYSGSIMLLSARVLTSGRDFNNTPPTEEQSYGVAVSIVANKSNPNSGDSKGLLNTDKSFLKDSDFNISESVLSSKLPSEITRNDLTLLNNGFFTNNTTKDESGHLKYVPFSIHDIDDQKGTFQVTVNLDQIPWFTTTLPNDSIPKTITKSFTTGKKIVDKISWKDDSALTYDFKNTIPSKVVVEDLNNFDPFQVSFNSKVVLNSDGSQQYPKKTYSVESHDDTQGTVNIKIVYQYVPLGSNDNTPLTYVGNHTYNVFKSGTEKKFYFAGAKNAASSTSSETIDINNVPQLKSLSESNLLPSNFSGNDQNSFLQFVNTNSSIGYPISKMDFSVVANDDDGTLKITASVKKTYDFKGETFVQLFTGFNKKKSYHFAFNENAISIDNKNFSTMLASSINDGDVVNNLISYKGFNSSDFAISLYPNDDKGELLVKIDLDKSYVKELGNSNGFSNYSTSFTFKGFMTNQIYNNQYNIEFLSDDDSTLVDLKKLTPQTIYDSLQNKQSLIVGNNTYTSLNELVEKLLVKTKGSKVPTGWNNNSSITTQMSYNNQAGTINIALSINKSLLNGYESNLDYVISYTGFSKGNAVVTNDNLTFVSNELLKGYVSEISNMSASQMKQWLEDNKSQNIKKLLFNVTGEYETKINSNDFKLIIESNDAYNTISITISFDSLSNSNSLKEYSIQYKL